MYLAGGLTTSYALSYSVNLNTSSLMGHPAGPFFLEFQLTDGSGLDDANNTAILSNFSFGAGSAVGSPTLTGGASGSLSSSVTLTDSSFFNQFIQQFTPGTVLSFTLALTTNVDSGPTPDLLSFSILDKTGIEIPTLAGFADVFLAANIDSTTPVLRTFDSDITRGLAGGGEPIVISHTQDTGAVVPEPNTFVLLGSAGLVLIYSGRVLNRNRRR